MRSVDDTTFSSTFPNSKNIRILLCALAFTKNLVLAHDIKNSQTIRLDQGHKLVAFDLSQDTFLDVNPTHNACKYEQVHAEKIRGGSHRIIQLEDYDIFPCNAPVQEAMSNWPSGIPSITRAILFWLLISAM